MKSLSRLKYCPGQYLEKKVQSRRFKCFSLVASWLVSQLLMFYGTRWKWHREPRFRQHLDRQGTNTALLAWLSLKSTWDPDDQHSGPDVSQDTGHYYWIPQLKSPILWPAEPWSEVSGSFSPIIIWEFFVCNYYNTKTGAGSQWKIWGESDMKDYLVKESKYYSNNFSSSGN